MAHVGARAGSPLSATGAELLTRVAAPLLVAWGGRRGRAAVAAPQVLPTKLIPALSCHHMLLPP